MKELSLIKPLLKQIVSKAIKENNWGIYLKGEPITKVPMQDGAPMFKVTDVELSDLLQAIDTTELED